MAEYRPSWDQEDFNATGDTEKRRNPRSSDDRLQRDFEAEENPSGFDREIRKNSQLFDKLAPDWRTKGLTAEQAERLMSMLDGGGSDSFAESGGSKGYGDWLKGAEKEVDDLDRKKNPFDSGRRPPMFPGDRAGQ